MAKLSSKTLWYVCKEDGWYSVRRTERDASGNKKQVRRDRNEYRLFENDRAEVAAYVARLNAKENPGQKVREAQIIENAFISVSLLEKFEAHLKEGIPSENYVKGIMGRVKNHFLNFFMRELKLNDPIEWHRVHKEKWSKYLNRPDLALSPKSKMMIVQAANRFIAWLSERRPDVPKLVFEPISKAKFSTMRAEYDADETILKPCMISEEDWKTIKDNLPEDITPFIHLGYNYGLRRAEMLALDVRDVKNEYLSIERQLHTLVRDTEGKVKSYKTKILKGKTNRKVPHWNFESFSASKSKNSDSIRSMTVDPSQTYEWVKSSTELRVMPDTLTLKWTAFMSKLGMTYTLHDLRHTWVTKMLRTRLPRDVQLAAGHKDINTTMRYAHDDRNLADQVFVPKKIA
jgi:integrase